MESNQGNYVYMAVQRKHHCMLRLLRSLKPLLLSGQLALIHHSCDFYKLHIWLPDWKYLALHFSNIYYSRIVYIVHTISKATLPIGLHYNNNCPLLVVAMPVAGQSNQGFCHGIGISNSRGFRLLSVMA